MELYIEENRWSQDRISGRRSVNLAAKVIAFARVGEIAALSTERQRIVIDEVNEDSVSMSVRYTENPAADVRFTLSCDETHTYAPRSFGAGYIYHFTLRE